MNYRKFQIVFFLVIMLSSLILTLLVFRSYLVLLAFGGVLAILFRPLFRFIHRFLKSDGLSAFLTVIAMAVAVLLPLTFFFLALYGELVGAVSSAKGYLNTAWVMQFLQQHLPPSVYSQVPPIMDPASKIVGQIGSTISSGLISFFSDLAGAIIGTIVIMIVVYYLLKDGDKMKRKLIHLSPLDDGNDELVLKKVIVAVRAVMGGILVVGALKAVVAGISLAATGVPAPIFWGSMTGLASMLPIFGTAIILVPAVAYLLLTGHIAAGIVLAVIAVGVVNPIDNILQPILVQSQTNIHPLLILMSILGGLKFYGFSGFILGPLTLAVTMALLDIYERDFRKYLQNTT